MVNLSPEYKKIYQKIIKYEPAIKLFSRLAKVRYVEFDDFLKYSYQYVTYGGLDRREVMILDISFTSTVACLKTYIPEMTADVFKWILNGCFSLDVLEVAGQYTSLLHYRILG